MKLIFRWDSPRLWVLECMGWLVGLMYCLMGGNLLIFISYSVFSFDRPAYFHISLPCTCEFYPFNLSPSVFWTVLIHSTVQRWLSTAPGAPTTHWYQLRCVLSQPIYVMAGQEITGRLHMVAHNAQSYTIYLTLSGLFLSSLPFFCLKFCLADLFLWVFNKL